jgi:Pvc16 N-terminal domain
MSYPNAIAAVTATLQAILGTEITADPDLTDATVTALPLDKARGTNTANQLNLFLYQVLPNAAWRNMDMPKTVRPGETGMSPLALDLHYLITAFGRENDTSQPFDHHLLGKAMSVLYDHALLGPEEIATAFPGSGLESQPDRVRITLQPLSVEDISKLWMGFATQYRVSVGYDVSVTLIDSTQPVKAPLPVLTRGPQDKGPVAPASIVPPIPTLYSVTPPNQQPSARLLDQITLAGVNLDGSNVGVQFNHPLWTAPVTIPAPGGSSTQVTVQIPNQPAVWPAGFYTVAVQVQRPGETYVRTTNQLSFSLAPTLTLAPVSAPAGDITYTATCSPQVWPTQIASLLLGNLEVAPEPFTAQTPTLIFDASNVAAGSYYFRLRVDGVDSLLVNRSVSPPVFDSTQQVTVTP